MDQSQLVDLYAPTGKRQEYARLLLAAAQNPGDVRALDAGRAFRVPLSVAQDAGLLESVSGLQGAVEPPAGATGGQSVQGAALGPSRPSPGHGGVRPTPFPVEAGMPVPAVPKPNDLGQAGDIPQPSVPGSERFAGEVPVAEDGPAVEHVHVPTVETSLPAPGTELVEQPAAGDVAAEAVEVPVPSDAERDDAGEPNAAERVAALSVAKVEAALASGDLTQDDLRAAIAQGEDRKGVLALVDEE